MTALSAEGDGTEIDGAVVRGFEAVGAAFDEGVKGPSPTDTPIMLDDAVPTAKGLETGGPAGLNGEGALASVREDDAEPDDIACPAL